MSTDSAPDRSALRKLIDAMLPHDSDLEAFCLDSFPHTARNFSDSMERKRKVNLLLTRETPAAVIEKLQLCEPDQFEKYRHLADCGTAEVSSAPLDPPTSAAGADWDGFNLLKNPGVRFVGREDELRVFTEGLTGSTMRIGIATGPGGMGKSSLLFHIWKQCADQFRSSQCIDCSDAPDNAQLLSRINRWLFSQGITDLEVALRSKQLSDKEKLIKAADVLEDKGPFLLGLDSFESVLARNPSSGAPTDQNVLFFLSLLARRLLRSKVLIASRERFLFDAAAESVVSRDLFDLSLSEAVQKMKGLPRLGAQGTEGDFADLYEAGIRSPLSVDLVEAELQDYGLVEVKANAQQRLHDELVETQQLVLIHARLSPAAQALLRRASVFREPVLHAMLMVHLPAETDTHHEALKALLDRSLLNAVDIKVGDTPQKHYRMHETARQWAEQKLLQIEGVAGLAHARRRAGYAYLAQIPALQRQRVLQYAIPAYQLLRTAEETEVAYLLAASLAPLIDHQFHEGYSRGVIEEMLSRLQGSQQHHVLAAKSHLYLGRILAQSDHQASQSHLERALELCRKYQQRALESESLGSLALLQLERCQKVRARELGEQSLRLSRELGDPRCLVNSNYVMAVVEQASMAFPSALQHCMESLNTFGRAAISTAAPGSVRVRKEEGAAADACTLRAALEQIQSVQDMAFILAVAGRMLEMSLVGLILRRGDPLVPVWTQLLAVCESLLSVCIAEGDARAEAHLLAITATMEYYRGNRDTFAQLMQHSIKLSHNQRNLRAVASKTAILANSEQDGGRYSAARGLYEQYLAMEDQLGQGSPLAVYCQGQLAWLEKESGNDAAARTHLMQALARLDSLPDPDSLPSYVLRINLLRELGLLERLADNTREAERRNQEWIALFESLIRKNEADGNHALAARLGQQLSKQRAEAALPRVVLKTRRVLTRLGRSFSRWLRRPPR
jgi:hypothetical protein